MNTLDRINQLMEERSWSKYKLAKMCGMSLSTISNMFRRNASPTVDTIQHICDAFGITLSQFFDVDGDSTTVHLTQEQKQLFDKWAMLTPEQKELLSKLVDNMK